jgi:hypothetical protein
MLAMAMALQLAEPAWLFSTTTDPITGRETAQARLNSGRTALAIGCAPGGGPGAGVAIGFERPVSFRSRVELILRLGDERPIYALAFPAGRTLQLEARPAQRVIDAVLAGQRVAAQVEGTDRMIRSVVFEPAADSQPVRDAIARCGASNAG